MSWTVGVARRVITPPWGVELAGWGYYLERTWKRVRDELTATALVVTDDGGRSVAIAAVDLMYNDAAFTRNIREQVARHTDIAPEAVCVNCSHSHNAPTAGIIRGGGAQEPEYLRWAARQAATAIILAWSSRQPARLFAGRGELAGMTFNRTREDGPVDTRLNVLRAEDAGGRPLAVLVNFHAHPTVHTTVDPHAVTRDWPGEVVDAIEAVMPGVTALYVQGTCGDVNFVPELNGTERRFEVARAVTGTALHALARARSIEMPGVAAAVRPVQVPTRRWTHDEVMRDREEGLHRLRTGDTTGWLDGVARVCVNHPQRLPQRYGGSVERAVAAVARFAVEWTEDILPDLDTRPETLGVETQALRIGDVYVAAHPAELFTTLALDLRGRWGRDDLFVLGYSNASIGYMPDAYDVARRSYAAYQSPRNTGQFPFTAASGAALIDGILNTLGAVESPGARRPT